MFKTVVEVSELYNISLRSVRRALKDVKPSNDERPKSYAIEDVEAVFGSVDGLPVTRKQFKDKLGAFIAVVERLQARLESVEAGLAMFKTVSKTTTNVAITEPDGWDES